MAKFFLLIFLAFCLILTACANTKTAEVHNGNGVTAKITENEGKEQMYKNISAEEAKKIMDTEENYIILDVREQDEFDEGHIPNAVLIPYTEIKNQAAEKLPDKDSPILVYCRSGRRSKIAAESLAELGYGNVKEFGGIIDWKYETVK